MGNVSIKVSEETRDKLESMKPHASVSFNAIIEILVNQVSLKWDAPTTDEKIEIKGELTSKPTKAGEGKDVE